MTHCQRGVVSLRLQSPGKKPEPVTGIPGHLTVGAPGDLEPFQLERNASTFSSRPVNFTGESALGTVM
jgi:hypothetical protein